MIWIDPNKRLPPQGKKIIWFGNGDTHICQRFGKYWFPIPFIDSRFAHLRSPEVWAEIKLPSPYKGKVMIIVDGKEYDIDNLEKIHNDIYRDILNSLLKDFRRHKKLAKMKKHKPSQ